MLIVLSIFYISCSALFPLCFCAPNGIVYSLSGNGWFVTDGHNYTNIPASVPNDIYNVLYEAKKIADPYLNDNDVKLRHVGKAQFNFSRMFELPSNLAQLNSVWLVSQGLDTVATVYLNDHKVARTDNMFRSYVWDVTKYIRKNNGRNTLIVAFDSPVTYSNDLYKNASSTIQYTLCQPGLVNGICQINYIRKMQASFGWDWGPAFPTQGIWRPLWLQATESCFIESLAAVPLLNGSRWSVQTKMKVWCSRQTQATITVALPELHVEEKWIISGTKLGLNIIKKQVMIPESANVRFWWPLGYGEQVLYKVAAKFVAKSAYPVSQLSPEISIGFRTVRLVQDVVPKSGLTFYIVVNDVPIFLKGTNWIPADSFLSRVTHDKLEYLFVSMVQANINSMRVWGGGVYETDYFYQLADKHGIVIWHDMMFACSLYPADEKFLANVRAEISDQVNRLQHHPSIVVWAGNNENELGLVGYWFHFGGQQASMERARQDYKTLYNTTIWGVINETDYGSRPYVMSSPSNGLKTIQEGGISNNPSNSRYGDMHVYNYASDAWMAPTYPKARCVTEYGFQSFPSMETLKKGIPNENELGYFTAQVTHRQHHTGGQFEMMKEVLDHFDLPHCKSYNRSNSNAGMSGFKNLCKDPVHPEKTEQQLEYDFLEAMIYLTQLHQAVAYQTESEHYRRWRNRTENGEGLCMCALYWQLNDIWEAPTWATIDYGWRWKAAHYLAKRFFAPVIVSPFWKDKAFQVAIVSDELKPLKDVVLTVDVLQWGNTEPVTSKDIKLDSVTPLTAQIVYNGSVKHDDKVHLIRTRLSYGGSRDALIAPENVLLPPQLFMVDKTLWGAVNITGVELVKPAHLGVTVTCSSICPFVWLDQAQDIVGYFSDNAFTMTTKTRLIIFTSWKKGLTVAEFKKKISVFSLGDLYR